MWFFVISIAASEVLRDITSVRLAEKKEQRTDVVMQYWQNKKGSVGELLDLLLKLDLLWPWDIINECEMPTLAVSAASSMATSAADGTVSLLFLPFLHLQFCLFCSNTLLNMESEKSGWV